MRSGVNNRKRSKTMAFRVTPEEYEEICELACLSGMDRQDYIVSRLKNKAIVVKPSTKVHKALKDEMGNVYAQLLRIRQGGALSPSLERTVVLLANVFVELDASDAEEYATEKERGNFLDIDRTCDTSITSAFR